MGISKSRGSASSTSLPRRNDYIDDTVSVQPSPEGVQVDKRYIHDTFVNKTALNLDRFGGVLKAIEGFISGSPIKVTYFHNQYTATDERTNDSDLSQSINPVHSDLLQINNFEFKLKEPFQYNFENGQLTSELRGTGVVYPGFVPVVSDFFLYELEPGFLGEFKVDTQPSRLSIRNGTCHEIAFLLNRFVSSDDINQIKQRVSDTAWFDKQRFLNGNASLLMYDDYATIKECEERIGVLLDYFMDTFWEGKEYMTYLRPDGVYDPYIVDFLRKTISTELLYKHPTQMLPDMKNKSWTIWEKLINPPTIPWDMLECYYNIQTKTYSLRDVKISALCNRDYLEVDKGLDPTLTTTYNYVVDDVSGVGLDGYDGYEKLLCAYLNNQVINAKELMTEVSNYLYWEKVDQFYKIPVLIYLMQRLISGLKNGTLRFTQDTSKELPVELPFTQALVENNEIQLQSLDEQKVLAVIDENDTVWYPNKGYLNYGSDYTSINLFVIFNERSITEVTGTWKVLMTKGGSVIRDPNNP